MEYWASALPRPNIPSPPLNSSLMTNMLLLSFNNKYCIISLMQMYYMTDSSWITILVVILGTSSLALFTFERKSLKLSTILAVISHLSKLMPPLSSIMEFTGNHWFYNSQINERMHVMDEHLTLFSWTQVKIFYEGWQDLLQTCWSRTVNWSSRLGIMALS